MLGNVAPLFLMCDPGDIGVVSEVRSYLHLYFHCPIYFKYPAGIGLSERLYQLHEQLLRTAKELVEDCACEEGCPSCVGPASLVGTRGKANTVRLLEAALSSH